MAAGVRITMANFPPAGGPEAYDTTTFASPSAAVSGIVDGFIEITTVSPAEVVALSVAQIKSIVAATF